MADDKLSAALSPNTDPLFQQTYNAFESFEKTPEMVEAKGQMSSDRAREQEAYGQEKTALESRQGLIKDQISRAQGFQKQLEGVPPVGDQAGYFKTSMPFFMLLSAVGGIMGKGAATVGMNAMNGMLEGQMEGNQAKYMMAKQKHDDAIAKLSKEYETATAVSDMMLKATEGQVDSAKLAQQAAAAAIGADEKTIDKMRGDFKDIYKAVLQEHSKQQDRAREGDRIRLLKDYAAAEGQYPRLLSAKVDADRALDLLPKILQKYRADTKNGPAGVSPKPLAQWMVSTGDQDVQQFSSYLRDAKPILAALETAGTGARSNMLLQTMISETVPTDVLNKGAGEIDTLVRNAKALLDASLQAKRNVIDAYRAEGTRIGVNLGAEPTLDIPPSALPSEPAPQKKAPPKQGEIKNGYRFKGGNPAYPYNWEAVEK